MQIDRAKKQFVTRRCARPYIVYLMGTERGER
jgi:hypothetical protein